MKKILWLLLISFSFFFTSQVDAAEILQSKGSGFSSPTVQDNKVRINLTGGNVKYIRHTKYEQSSWNNPTAYKQLRASSSFTGFAYSCPGYYMTRIYSDSAGTNLIGWVRVYVSNSDINNAACPSISDTTKNVPPTTKKINVTHPSDVVDEPSKMITQSTTVSSSSPVVRDTTDEDLVEFSAGQVPEGTLTAEQACNVKAANTGVAWQLKYNSNTSSWECVVTSDCMNNAGLWHCNAPTVSERYAASLTTIDNPERDLYNEDSCSDATAANCLDMYSMSNYSRPTNDVVNEHSSGGGTTTEPGETEPEEPGETENPNRDPVMEAKCTLDSGFNSEECIKYRFCLDSPDHPTCQENTAPPEVEPDACFVNGEPAFDNPDCFFNCELPGLANYEECKEKPEYQSIKYCWDENGDFKYDSPYCQFLNCDKMGGLGTDRIQYHKNFGLWEECGGPIACDNEQARMESELRLMEMGYTQGEANSEVNYTCIVDIYYEINDQNLLEPDTCWYTEASTDDNVKEIRMFMFKKPGCNPCEHPEYGNYSSAAIEYGISALCPEPGAYDDLPGGIIKEVADLVNTENPGEEIPPDEGCACENALGSLCCIFECPGWEEYLGFITDTVEMAIGDITTPEVEPLPDLETPSTPSTPYVDKKQLAPPEGKEDPNLGNASFDANDLKSGEEIQFREDPGGFNIVDPLQQLEGTANEAPQPTLGSVTQPRPTGGNASSGTAQQPQYNGGTATAPTTGGTAQQPDYSGSARVPTYNP